MNDYRPVLADESLEHDLRCLVRLAIAEDLDDSLDWTTVCLIEEDRRGSCEIVPRVGGIVAGLAVLPWIVDEFDADISSLSLAGDGEVMEGGRPIARLEGNVRDLLTAERTILNVLSRMCGVASLTRRYVDRLGDSPARLYDTRKTTPGWRRLEKYAVRCGGGHNHRTGLHDGFLIKDNHLAFFAAGLGDGSDREVTARTATERVSSWRGGRSERLTAPEIVEVEVDSLGQLDAVLAASPDIILVDNFSTDEIREAVRRRDLRNPRVELEASGNITLDTIAEVAATGVERISCGALTHQATWLDLGLDWSDGSAS